MDKNKVYLMFLLKFTLFLILTNCSPSKNDAPHPLISTDNKAISEETVDLSIQGSLLFKIIEEMEVSVDDLEFEAGLAIFTNNHRKNILESVNGKRSFLDDINQHTTNFLLKRESANDYLFFLLQKRALYLQLRYEHITLYKRIAPEALIQPTSLKFFKFVNNNFYQALKVNKNDIFKKHFLRFNKRIRILTISWYELFQLLIKETLSLCDIESLDKKTIDILRASHSLHAFIINPEKEDLGHPDEVVSVYHILESILLGYPKSIEDNEQLTSINKKIKEIKKEIKFEKLEKNKDCISSRTNLIKSLLPLLFSESATRSNLSKPINYLSKDLDGAIIRNHFCLKDTNVWELDEKSNYVQSKWPYPLPKPVFLEKAIAKYSSDPAPTKDTKPNVQRHKPNINYRKPNPPINTKTNRKQRSGNRTTIHNFTNAGSPANKELEKKEKALEPLDLYSQHVEDPTRLPASTLANPEPQTAEVLGKTDIEIISSQPLQEETPSSIEAHLRVEGTSGLPASILTNPESQTDEVLKKPDMGIIPRQLWQEKELSSVEAPLQYVEESSTLSSITFANPQSPTDEVLEKTDIEDYSIYYSDYNEYKDPKNYENKKLIKDSEKNIAESEKETWKQPAGARRFNSHLLDTRETYCITTTHQKTVNKIFDPKRQCKVKFSEFVTLWESIDGKLTGNMHGGSHRQITAPDGKVVTGIFTHGNGTMYGKRSIQYLKMALECVGLQPTE